MEKEDIVKTILEISKEMGISAETKVKTDKWKADMLW